MIPGKKDLIIIFLLLCLSQSTAFANLAKITKAAEFGDAAAQHSLGEMYLYGNGVGKSESDAMIWFMRSTEQGNIESMAPLAYLYLFGDVIDADYSLAINLLEEASESGDSWAQRLLGICYRRGLGIEKDAEEAAHWMYRSAASGDLRSLNALSDYAEEGVINAQRSLGHLYQAGQGVDADIGKSQYWYAKATRQGDTESAKSLMSLAIMGNTEAQYETGHAFMVGDGFNQSYRSAGRWFLKAAEQGHAGAQVFLAEMYGKGVGYLQDFAECYAWAAVAYAVDGDHEAQEARDYCKGELTEEEFVNAKVKVRKYFEALPEPEYFALDKK